MPRNFMFTREKIVTAALKFSQRDMTKIKETVKPFIEILQQKLEMDVAAILATAYIEWA